MTSWSDAGSREALSLVAASVAEMVGFEIAIISVVRGDRMHSVAVEGSHEIRTAMLGVATPLRAATAELERADDWGRFRFVPHERTASDLHTVGWVPDMDPVEGEDAWHPLDLLVAPLYGEDGAMLGLLSIDLPLTRRRPDPTQRHLLERYAAQAERTLRMAVERDELGERIRLAEAARGVVRFASAQDDLERVLDDCRAPLLEGFRADYLGIRTYATSELAAVGSPPPPVSEALMDNIRDIARRAWDAQGVVVAADHLRPPGFVSEEQNAAMLLAVHDTGMATSMLVPLGSGTECLGHIALGRVDPSLPWSPDERASAFDVARDIAQAVVRSRNLAHEQRLVEQLRDLATYKAQVLSTVSHELKNPLGAILGHLELLEGVGGMPTDARRSVAALERAALRMRRVVDDLLALAEIEDPEADVPGEVLDVRAVIDEAVQLTREGAENRDLHIDVVVPHEEALVSFDADDLDRVLTNLLSNAVKYTHAGGSVALTVTVHDEEVEIAVADEGIGISEADQERLFTEFFRSTNPQAVARPGTGLGLTICKRIVERHGGRIGVQSTLGEGSTFRVSLPRASRDARVAS
ncbi:hypothetical protein GCM10023340_19310 [Nocardioides marinquilinus]|uniref:histidine kinase n=1 Tax=Nocardioides marinquilinus TaxID=1210400 RepID=A0ABP9PLT3_9ACTN